MTRYNRVKPKTQTTTPVMFSRNHVSLTSVILISVISYVIPSINIAQAARGKSREVSPIELNEETWTQLLKDEWMVNFFAPWCPACKSSKPEFQQLAEWSDDLNIKVASADVTENPGLSGRFMVSGLPTIYHVKDGVFRIYSGPRNHKAMINFIEQQGWKAVQPISRWFAPDSLQMSFVAHSFRISMTLRDVHKYLVDDVGLPHYVSYLLFALCTVIFGTLLGILIVFLIDLCCPSPSIDSVQIKKTTSKGSKKDVDKNANESDLDDLDTSTKEVPDGKLTRRRVNN